LAGEGERVVTVTFIQLSREALS